MSHATNEEVVSSEGSSEESSSEEEEDETGKEWTEEIEKTFLKTLSSLKSKDPKIYDCKVSFFDENSVITPGQKSSEKPKVDQPMYLRDYERKMILEKGAILSDEEDEDHLKPNRNNSRTYVEEQKALKENFKKFLCSDHESSDDENNCAGFLKVKTKTAKEKTREEEEYVEWLKGQKTELSDKEAANQLQHLRNYWTDPNLHEEEQFLRDYILNKRFLEPSEELNDDELSFSEEERVLEECEEYEQQYNFRFEEPDKNFIKTYPRNIENSLRRKDEKRKKKREEKKKRREELLLQKQLEVKRMKKQKKAEMMDRIKKLKELTGNPQVGFDDNDLEKDFSPDEYDRKMNELFNEEFYDEEDLDEKPVFSDASSVFGDFDEDHLPEEEFNAEESADNIIDESTPIEDSDIIMDCDYDPRQSRDSKLKKQTRSARRKGHKKTKFAEVISKKKPVFNPVDRSFQQYVDEYYALNFEDLIGDLPCRFKYRKVTPNSFGLSVEEILAADDKDLNKWCAIQKIDSIRPEQNEKFDLKIYSRRANDIRLKKKYLPSLFSDENNVTESTSTAQCSSQSASAIKKNKKKLENLSNEKQQFSNKRKRSLQEDESNRNDKFKKRRSSPSAKNKFRQLPPKNTQETGISDERLKAYGINPKKYKNKMKYGKNNR